jgi:hypothetical protein
MRVTESRQTQRLFSKPSLQIVVLKALNEASSASWFEFKTHDYIAL